VSFIEKMNGLFCSVVIFSVSTSTSKVEYSSATHPRNNAVTQRTAGISAAGTSSNSNSKATGQNRAIGQVASEISAASRPRSRPEGYSHGMRKTGQFPASDALAGVTKHHEALADMSKRLREDYKEIQGILSQGEFQLDFIELNCPSGCLVRSKFSNRYGGAP